MVNSVDKGFLRWNMYLEYQRIHGEWFMSEPSRMRVFKHRQWKHSEPSLKRVAESFGCSLSYDSKPDYKDDVIVYK